MFKIFNNQKGAVPLITLLLLLVGIGAAVYLSQKPTDLKPSADVVARTPEMGFYLVRHNENRTFNEGDVVKVDVGLRSDFFEVSKFIAKVKFDNTKLEVKDLDVYNGKLMSDSSSSNSSKRGLISEANAQEAPPATNPACLLQSYSYSRVGTCNKGALNTITFRCGGDTVDKVKTYDCTANVNDLYGKALTECKNSLACKPTPVPVPTPTVKPTPTARPTANPACGLTFVNPLKGTCNPAGVTYNKVEYQCGSSQKVTLDLSSCVSDTEARNQAKTVCQNSVACKPTPPPTATPDVNKNPDNFIKTWITKNTQNDQGVVDLEATFVNQGFRTTVKDARLPVVITINFIAKAAGQTTVYFDEDATALTDKSSGDKLDKAKQKYQKLTFTVNPPVTARPSNSPKPTPTAKPTNNPACGLILVNPLRGSCDPAGVTYKKVEYQCGGTGSQKVTLDLTSCVSDSEARNQAKKACENNAACKPVPTAACKSGIKEGEVANPCQTEGLGQDYFFSCLNEPAGTAKHRLSPDNRECIGKGILKNRAEEFCKTTYACPAN